jgi:hypothetical protein
VIEPLPSKCAAVSSKKKKKLHTTYRMTSLKIQTPFNCLQGLEVLEVHYDLGHAKPLTSSYTILLLIHNVPGTPAIHMDPSIKFVLAFAIMSICQNALLVND